MKPTNSSIIVEPFPDSQQEGGGVRTPSSALFLAKAKIVDIGSSVCVIDGNIVDKNDLIPGIEVGKTVYYIKMAEDRLDVDAAYRIKTPDNKYNLIIRIQDIRAIES